MIDELLDEKQVCKMLGGISRPTLYRGIKTGRYPRPIKVGIGRNRWPLSSFRTHGVERLKKKRDEIVQLLPPRKEDWATVSDENVERIQLLNRQVREIEAELIYLDGCVPPSPARSSDNRNEIQREVRDLLDGAARRGRRRIGDTWPTTQ